MRRVIAIDALYACAALGTCMAERGRHAPLRMLAFLLVPTTDPERLLLGHYQALYAATPVLQRTFRTRRWRRRRPHRSPDARSSYRLATPMVMIDQRPTAADDRVEVGHWEGDLIMGLGNGSAIGTLVERSTRILGSRQRQLPFDPDERAPRRHRHLHRPPLCRHRVDEQSAPAD